MRESYDTAATDRTITNSISDDCIDPYSDFLAPSFTDESPTAVIWVLFFSMSAAHKAAPCRPY